MLHLANVGAADMVLRPRLGRRPHRHHRGTDLRRARRRDRTRRKTGRTVAAECARRWGRGSSDVHRTPISLPPTFRTPPWSTLYLSPSMNRRLEPKLLKELKPGARVVSHQFPIPGWTPTSRRRVTARRSFCIAFRRADRPQARARARERSAALRARAYTASATSRTGPRRRCACTSSALLASLAPVVVTSTVSALPSALTA